MGKPSSSLEGDKQVGFTDNGRIRRNDQGHINVVRIALDDLLALSSAASQALH